HMHTLDDAATAAMLTLPLHDALPIWQWWRVSGRSQNDMPDGITGATQPVGTHSIKVADDHPALRELPAGKYEVVVEAAREKGGREVLRLPLPWPPGSSTSVDAKGETELGQVRATILP